MRVNVILNKFWTRLLQCNGVPGAQCVCSIIKYNSMSIVYNSWQLLFWREIRFPVVYCMASLMVLWVSSSCRLSLSLCCLNTQTRTSHTLQPQIFLPQAVLSLVLQDHRLCPYSLHLADLHTFKDSEKCSQCSHHRASESWQSQADF